MDELLLYYATNRNHIGKNRWRPIAYGPKFSDDGMENLRFGKVMVPAEQARINRYVRAKKGGERGDGEGLADYLTEQARNGRIEAFRESIDPRFADVHQADATFGSLAMFEEIRRGMDAYTDVLIYIHGFNVDWHRAVGATLALQCMLNRAEGDGQKVMVVLFTWPSDGLALPFVSYKSDQSEARGSGNAVGRALLKARDFLASPTATAGNQCGRDIHLLCHSLGGYVLQHALARIAEFHTAPALPRLFEQIFLCAADVDDDSLENGRPLGRLHELCRELGVYYNNGDLVMYISDYTKGNPERLGTAGVSRPAMVHNKVYQIDCSPLVKGLTEHSYYLWGPVNEDIALSIGGRGFDDPARRRQRHAVLNNVWYLR